jgi:hypothetical protein
VNFEKQKQKKNKNCIPKVHCAVKKLFVVFVCLEIRKNSTEFQKYLPAAAHIMEAATMLRDSLYVGNLAGD